MGRQTWATDEQVTWLSGRKKGFIDAQAKGTTRAYINSSLELFIQKWPVADPTPAELLDADGDLDKAKTVKLQKLRQQIEWWIRNRNRPNAANGKGKGQVLSLARKKLQMMAPYQAYMHLYPEHVMPELKAAYLKYLPTVKEGEKIRHFWSLVTEEGPRLLAEEPQEIKDEVEEFRQRHYQEQIPTPITFEELMKEGPASGQKKAAALQISINLLARTGLEALKAIEDQTGFKGSLILGGPNPETGRIVTLAIHHGSTMQLDNIWPEAEDDWSIVQKSFDNFIARCFPPELPAQLEKLFNGEAIDMLSETPTTDATTSATPTTSTTAPTMPTDTTHPATSNSVLPAAVAAPATVSAPGLDATPPSAIPPSSPAAISCSRAAPQSTGQNGTAEDAHQTRTEVAPSTILYDDEIRARHARNLRIWQVMSKMPGITAEEAGKLVDEDGDIEEPQEPEWMREARDHLLEASEEGWWRSLVETWQSFEKGLKYPDGGNARNRLSSKFRPEEAKNWINRGCNYARPSKIKTLTNFITGFRKWWARLQPACRQVPDQGWPLLRTVPKDDSSWAEVKKGGCNGLFMVLMCLSWWLREVQEKEVDATDLREAADDVRWVLIQLTPAEKPPPTSGSSAPAPPLATSSESVSPTLILPQPTVTASESAAPSSSQSLTPPLEAASSTPSPTEPAVANSAMSLPIESTTTLLTGAARPSPVPASWPSPTSPHTSTATSASSANAAAPPSPVSVSLASSPTTSIPTPAAASPQSQPVPISLASPPMPSVTLELSTPTLPSLVPVLPTPPPTLISPASSTTAALLAVLVEPGSAPSPAVCAESEGSSLAAGTATPAPPSTLGMNVSDIGISGKLSPNQVGASLVEIVMEVSPPSPPVPTLKRPATEQFDEALVLKKVKE